MTIEEIIAEFRDYIRDYAASNDLLQAEESTDTQLQTALKIALARFNSWPPVTQYTLEQAYDKIGPFLFEAALPHLLRSIALSLVRNEAQIPGAPPLSTNEQTRIQTYLNLAMQLEQIVRQELSTTKAAMNTENAFDIIDGEAIAPGMRFLEDTPGFTTSFSTEDDDEGTP